MKQITTKRTYFYTCNIMLIISPYGGAQRSAADGSLCHIRTSSAERCDVISPKEVFYCIVSVPKGVIPGKLGL